MAITEEDRDDKLHKKAEQAVRELLEGLSKYIEKELIELGKTATPEDIYLEAFSVTFNALVELIKKWGLPEQEALAIMDTFIKTRMGVRCFNIH